LTCLVSPPPARAATFAQNPSRCPNLQIRVAAAPMFATDDVPQTQTSTGFTVKLILAAERFQDLVARLS